MTARQPERRTRDAERSRETLLAVAEERFAEAGFDGCSLADVAARAGLSRGTPSYFFGSKEQLYEAVLERVFADREQATRDACAPLVQWSRDTSPPPLERALTEAVEGYLAFLRDRPAFVQLLQREELAGAARLREVPRESRAIEDAFAAIRAVAPDRGLRAFDVADAVLLFVSLTFSPLAQRATFLTALGRDLDDPTTRSDHVKMVVDQILHLVGERS